MSALRLLCPHCGCHLKARSIPAGRSLGRCPVCAASIRMPAGSRRVAPSPVLPPRLRPATVFGTGGLLTIAVTLLLAVGGMVAAPLLLRHVPAAAARQPDQSPVLGQVAQADGEPQPNLAEGHQTTPCLPRIPWCNRNSREPARRCFQTLCRCFPRLW
jgi:hypothetical protein